MKLASLDLNNSTYLELESIQELKISVPTKFDSYHNSFFTSYWNKYTVLKNGYISVFSKGSGILSLIKNENGYETILNEVTINNKDYYEVKIPFDITNTQGERLYLSATPSVDKQLELKNNVSWNTNQRPIKDIKLAVIMCTFNKQEYINKNLDLLLKDKVFQKSSTELFVIDNASNLNLKSTDKFHYFQQKNFGGAGGFTRGLIEARAMNKFTHYQFMDDDILLDPDMILRTHSFLSFTETECAFSGAMLCMNDKNRIWEAGADYPHPKKNLTPKPCMFDTEINNDLLNKISKPYNFDYGGWWFFTFSEKIVQKIGLPYPFFIRGDDVEYSLRIKKNNFDIVNLPGICVWHETFYGKTGYWLQYYNTRNYIIFSLMYFSWVNSLKLVINLIKSTISDLLFFQYQKVFITNKAIFDLQTSLFKFHTKSTPEHQLKLLNSISHIKDYSTQGTQSESISPGNFFDILIKLITLNYHILYTHNKSKAVIDSHAWKPRFLKSRVPLGISSITISNKNNNQCFTFDKNSLLFFKLSVKSIINFTFFIFLLPFYKFCLPLLFKRYEKTKFWNNFLKGHN